jgi:hypothetical protein
VPEAPAATGPKAATFRYGAVFCLTLTTVAVLILAPATDVSHAVAFALEDAALVVVVATSRSRPAVRRVRAVAGALAGGLWVLAVAIGLPPQWLVLAAGGLVSIAIPLALVGGVLRLVRRHGATLEAILGSLAIYLLVGLAFAWVIGLVARLDPAAYFANGTDGTEGGRVYLHGALQRGHRRPDRPLRVPVPRGSPARRCSRPC